MESLLTLSIGDYRLVDMTLCLAATLIGMTALLQILCISVVTRDCRLPLALSGVALLGAACFESGVWLAWKEAFELAGTSYCVTGHLLAGEERIIAWSLGLPVIFICFGMLHLNTREKGFRNLCWTALGWAVLGPFFQIMTLIGFLLCVLPFSGILIGASKKQRGVKAVSIVAVTSIALGMIVTELGYLRLLPLGKSAEDILIHGEIVHTLCDLLALVVPAVALLIGALKISGENPQTS